MDKIELTDKILSSRTKTYAAGSGKVKPVFAGSYQLEYSQGDWFYRDVYYNGKGIFNGLETIYFKGDPVWSMSYFGDYSKMTEEQADTLLREALIDLWQETRMFKKVEKDFSNFHYVCDGQGSIDELNGTEEILVNNKRVYFFYYAGGYIGRQ